MPQSHSLRKNHSTWRYSSHISSSSSRSLVVWLYLRKWKYYNCTTICDNRSYQYHNNTALSSLICSVPITNVALTRCHLTLLNLISIAASSNKINLASDFSLLRTPYTPIFCYLVATTMLLLSPCCIVQLQWMTNKITQTNITTTHQVIFQIKIHKLSLLSINTICTEVTSLHRDTSRKPPVVKLRLFLSKL